MDNKSVQTVFRFLGRVRLSLANFLRYRVMMSTRNVLIIGGSNPLGSTLATQFRSNWRVVNLDYFENETVGDNILIPSEQGVFGTQTALLLEE